MLCEFSTRPFTSGAALGTKSLTWGAPGTALNVWTRQRAMNYAITTHRRVQTIVPISNRYFRKQLLHFCYSVGTFTIRAERERHSGSPSRGHWTATNVTKRWPYAPSEAWFVSASDGLATLTTNQGKRSLTLPGPLRRRERPGEHSKTGQNQQDRQTPERGADRRYEP